MEKVERHSTVGVRFTSKDYKRLESLTKETGLNKNQILRTAIFLTADEIFEIMKKKSKV